MFGLRLLEVALALLTAASSVSGEGMVLTPRGLRRSSTVHQVPAGGKVQHMPDSSIHVLDPSGATIEVVNPEVVNPEVVARRAPTPILSPNDLFAYGQVFNSNDVMPYGTLNVSFAVPPQPTKNDNQSVFLSGPMMYSVDEDTFADFTNSALQWGPSAAGGGAFWSVSTWYFASGEMFFTPLVNVSVGQTLNTEMQLIGIPNCAYNYLTQFTNIPGTNMLIFGAKQLRGDFLSLEVPGAVIVNGVTTRGEYPVGSTTFTTALRYLNRDSPGAFWGAISNTQNNRNVSASSPTNGADAVIRIDYGCCV
ncbi:hypothetical protein MKEN_01242000 [Mycena kentingensis (nom. inval.)]|nr:hypothetical protein MKEN_01242000 [Mycena kentingensis (nom. inval.)]